MNSEDISSARHLLHLAQCAEESGETTDAIRFLIDAVTILIRFAETDIHKETK